MMGERILFRADRGIGDTVPNKNTKTTHTCSKSPGTYQGVFCRSLNKKYLCHNKTKVAPFRKRIKPLFESALAVSRRALFQIIRSLTNITPVP